VVAAKSQLYFTLLRVVDDVEELCEMKITLPSLLFYHELPSFKDEDERERRKFIIHEAS
jgi:hypothetical protein